MRGDAQGGRNERVRIAAAARICMLDCRHGFKGSQKARSARDQPKAVKTEATSERAECCRSTMGEKMRLKMTVAAAALAVVSAVTAARGDMFGSIWAPLQQQNFAAQLKAIDDANKAAVAKQAQAQQLALQGLIEQLKTLGLDQLYTLRMSGLCQAGILQCGPVAENTVRGLVDNELSRRTAIAAASDQAAAAEDRSRTFYISLVSLIVSGLAFLLSVFSTFRKGGAVAVET
jgi:hypothetical protein